MIMFLRFPVCYVRQLFLCNCITKQNTDDNIKHTEAKSLIYNSHANRLPDQNLTVYHKRCNAKIYFQYRITLQQALQKQLKLKKTGFYPKPTHFVQDQPCKGTQEVIFHIGKQTVYTKKWATDKVAYQWRWVLILVHKPFLSCGSLVILLHFEWK